MSAFIVNHKHINALVTFASLHGVTAWSTQRQARITVNGDEQAAAELLLAENTRSVNHRYKSTDPVEPLVFNIVDPYNQDPVAILRACDCLEYQSCETDDYKQTDAYALLDAIRGEAICLLPGYNLAAWEIR